MAMICLCCKAQQDIKALTIGDSVPDIYFEKMLNYDKPVTRLSDFKGKYLILDLWSTWCRSCIEAFPKMEQIQEQFKNDLQIILVNPNDATYDSDEKINAVLTNYKKRNNKPLSLPIALRDTIINYLFPHKSVPHIVVISPDGYVEAITTAWAVSPGRIADLIKGKEKVFPPKNENGFDPKKPLFVKNNAGDGAYFMYRSLLTGYLDEANSSIGTSRDMDGAINRYYIINYPLIAVYRLAYMQELNLPANRIIIETANPFLWQQPANKDDELEKSFCYELIVPGLAPQKIAAYLRTDLERYFKTKVVEETRLLPCYTIKPNKNIEKASAKKSQIPRVLTSELIEKQIIQNQPVQVLVDYLNTISDKPVIHEGVMDQHITIEIPDNINGFEFKEWQALLSKRGFDLQADTRHLEVTIIKSNQ